MRPRAGLEERGKSCLPPGFDLWNVDPVTLRFTCNIFFWNY